MEKRGMMGTASGTGTAEQGELRLRDIRRKDWYWVEAVFVEVFLPVLGPLGGAVYNTLCSHVRQDEVRMSLREIGDSSGVSKDTVARMMWKMGVLGMVGTTTGGKGRYKYTCYVLYDLKDAAAGGIPALKAKLAEAEEARRKDSVVKLRTVVRVEENASGMLQFDEREAAAEDPAAEPFVSVGDKADAVLMSLTETKRMLPDDKVSQNETPFNTKKERDIKNTIPTLPQAEGLAGTESGWARSEFMPVTQGATVTLSPANPPMLAAVLDRIARLKPRLGDVADLRGQIESHMATAGFAVAHKVRVPDKGDGAAGYVEMLCTRMGRNAAGEPKTECVAFELDAAVPRERGLQKLRAMPDGCTRVIVLRTAAKYPLGDWGEPGIDRVISLGWPGNGQAERMADAKARSEAAIARARVGMAAPWVARPHEGVGLIETPCGVTVERLLTAVRETIEPFGEAAVDEWDVAFDGVSYERHEAVEGAAGGVLLVLASPHPEETVRGLSQYAARLEPAMAERFGGRVQVQVVAWDGAISAAGEENGCQL